MQIRAYADHDQDAVVALWHACDLVRPWNDPKRDIERKLTEQPELFLVGVEGERLLATAMAGFDGHRGWVSYLAVQPDARARSLGRQMMRAVEERLSVRGCPKLNLQVRSSNTQVIGFYQALGYAQDDVVSLGKRLIPD